MWPLSDSNLPSTHTPHSWWLSDLEQKLWACKQTCSFCFWHIPIRFAFHLKLVLLVATKKSWCTDLHGQQTHTSLGWQEAEIAKHPTSNWWISWISQRLMPRPHLPSGPWRSLCPPACSRLDLQLRLPPSHNKSLYSSVQLRLTGGLAATSSGTLDDRVSCSVISQPKSWTG